jgi:hypothetical protein
MRRHSLGSNQFCRKSSTVNVPQGSLESANRWSGIELKLVLMKTVLRLALCFSIILATTTTSRAINAMGKVFCDANQNSLFDANDPAIPGVFVVVTNLSGTFSNGNWTTTPDGRFVVALPNVADTYAAFILPDTLMVDSTVVIPPSGVAQFSVSNLVTDITTNFLVNSPACRTNSFQVIGQVFCDINFNGVIDPMDYSLGALVGITNLSGTFSNAVFSTNGTFLLNLPHANDNYVEFLIPSSLPPGFAIELPTGGVFSFSLGVGIRTNFFSRFLVSGACCPTSGITNSWTKTTSGKWEEPVWSLGILPEICQTIELTNSGFKAIAIDNSTATGYPGSLTIRHLDVYAPTGSFNTVLLNFAGTAVPLHVLSGVNVGTNGKILNLFSGLLVDTGGLVITNGEVAQQGGFTRVGDFIDVEGRYNLTNGLVQAPLERIGNGSVDSRFVENGGTNATSDLVLRGGPPVVRYDLLAGLLTAGSEEIFNGVRGTTAIAQSGGQNVVTNQLRLEGSAVDRDPFGPGIAQYILTGGTLSAGSILLGSYSSFAQSNGFATVFGAITFNAVSPFFRTTSFLAGGTLAAANLLFSGAGENLVQTGGTLIVTNLFSFAGFAFSPPLGFAFYDFGGGTLTASNIEMLANMTIGSAGGQTRRITNAGSFRLGGGGTLTTATIDERLGRFILAGSATIDMGAGASKLAFANSSAEAWTTGAVLSVIHWAGSTNGGGSDQLFFGTSATGLTASQVSQIRFVNPVGFAPGTYAARILSTGEIIPAAPPTLLFTRLPNAVVFSWQGSAVLQTATNVLGPYVDISGASSPRTNTIGTEPQRFFRLRL